MVWGRFFRLGLRRWRWEARLRRWEALRERALAIDPRLLDQLPEPGSLDGRTLDIEMQAFERLLHFKQKSAPHKEGR